MRIELGFLRTKVARSLFLRFVICALLPLGVLATISLRTVSRYLDERSDQRLGDAAAATERAVADRLALSSREVELLADLVSRNATSAARTEVAEMTGVTPADLHSRFAALKGATVVPPSGPDVVLFGEPVVPPALDQPQIQHLKDGNTVLVEGYRGTVPDLYMARGLGEELDEIGVLWARLDPPYLWRTSASLAALPSFGALSVLNAALTTLHGPSEEDESFVAAVRAAVEAHSGLGVSWDGEAGDRRFVTSPIALGPDYLSEDWQVVVSMPEEMVTAPLRDFTQAFLPLMLTAFLIVLILSDAQIRRTIRPLELIHDATKRIASEDFSGRLDIQSKDEFRDLARSFNAMSDRLGKQIQTLTAISHVDRAALSARDSRQIVDALLQTLLNVVDCETVSVCTIDQHGSGTSYAVSRDSREVTIVQVLKSESDDWCDQESGHVLLGPEARSERACLNVPPFGDHDHQRFLILPLEMDDRRAGLICFASTNADAFPKDEVRRLRQIADQATLALSNVDRLDELGRMSLGALTALARTIDANSPWTAGHSERVTRVATLIGQKVGLDAERLDALRRGGLLHDIGKIGVPVEILNKPGALSEKEFEAVKAHVVVGQRILEPIEAYADLIPIVRHHHERVDGNGYPDGLSGEDIDLCARIVGLADTFDALTSDRPYRQGLPTKTAVEVIRNASGTQLDPRLVEAFLELIDDGALDFLPGRLDTEEAEPTQDVFWPVSERAVTTV